MKLTFATILTCVALASMAQIVTVDKTPAPPSPPAPSPVFEVLVPRQDGVMLIGAALPALTNQVQSIGVSPVRVGDELESVRVSIVLSLTPVQASELRASLSPLFGLPAEMASRPVKSAFVRQTNGLFSVEVRFK